MLTLCITEYWFQVNLIFFTCFFSMANKRDIIVMRKISKINLEKLRKCIEVPLSVWVRTSCHCFTPGDVLIGHVKFNAYKSTCQKLAIALVHHNLVTRQTGSSSKHALSRSFQIYVFITIMLVYCGRSSLGNSESLPRLGRRGVVIACRLISMKCFAHSWLKSFFLITVASIHWWFWDHLI